MKLHLQKVFCLMIVLALCLGLLAVPASATPGDALDYEITQFWNMVGMDYENVDLGLTHWRNLVVHQG